MGTMKITALKIQARNKGRVNVYVDGKYGFAVAKIVAARLAIGQVLDEAAIAGLRGVDDVEKAYERALKFLAPRPRSVVEVRRRLETAKVPAETIEAVLQRLQRAGLLDDQAFANFWVENRGTFRPRSKRALRMEMKQKGLPEEAVKQALAETDDAGAAAALAAQRAPRLASLEYQDFRRKLGEFLGRRGFNYDTIQPVVEQAWKDLKAGPKDE
jgi:regulatory protein